MVRLASYLVMRIPFISFNITHLYCVPLIRFNMSFNDTVNLNDDRTPSVISAAVASMVLCVVFYLFRILSRTFSNTPILASDYTLFGGVIACFVISCVDLWG